MNYQSNLARFTILDNKYILFLFLYNHCIYTQVVPGAWKVNILLCWGIYFNCYPYIDITLYVNKIQSSH